MFQLSGQILAAVVKKAGRRVDGGYEVFLTPEEIRAIPDHGTIQGTNHPHGISLTYKDNKVIEGELASTSLIKL